MAKTWVEIKKERMGQGQGAATSAPNYGIGGSSWSSMKQERIASSPIAQAYLAEKERQRKAAEQAAVRAREVRNAEARREAASTAVNRATLNTLEAPETKARENTKKKATTAVNRANFAIADASDGLKAEKTYGKSVSAAGAQGKGKAATHKRTAQAAPTRLETEAMQRAEAAREIARDKTGTGINRATFERDTRANTGDFAKQVVKSGASGLAADYARTVRFLSDLPEIFIDQDEESAAKWRDGAVSAGNSNNKTRRKGNTRGAVSGLKDKDGKTVSLQEQMRKGLEETIAYDETQQAIYNNMADTKGRRIVGTIGQQIVQNVPDMVFGWAAASGKAATAAGKTIFKEGGERLAAHPDDLMKLGRYVKDYASEAFRNPMFYTSFMRVLGRTYENQLERIANTKEGELSKADERKAAAFAFLNGIGNAAIEVGGGIQTFNPSEGMLKGIARSAFEEGGEEVLQSVWENALDIVCGSGTSKVVAIDPSLILPLLSEKIEAGEDPEKAIKDIANSINKVMGDNFISFNAEDEAILNPSLQLREAAYGAAVGGILGGGQTAINTALRRALGEEIRNTAIPGPRLQLPTEGGGTSVDNESVSQIQENVNKNKESFAKKLDKWGESGFELEHGKAESYNIGKTSSKLVRFGVAIKDVFFNQGKIKTILTKHKSMNLDIVKQVPDVISDPIVVMRSKQSDSRITMFGEVKDEHGRPVLVVLELKPTALGNEVRDYYTVASAYGKKNVKNFINSSEILYVDDNADRAGTWIEDNGLTFEEIAGRAAELTNDVLGEAGKKGYNDIFAKKDPEKAVDFSRAYQAAYNAGKSGVSQEETLSRYTEPGTISMQEVFRAWASGVNDSNRARRESLRRGAGSVRDNTSGKILESAKAGKNKRRYTMLNRLAEASGANIVIEDSISTEQDGRTILQNGYYDERAKEIHIALDADNPLFVVAKHEITHHLKAISPKLYSEYAEYVMASMSEAEFNARYKLLKRIYSKNGLELSRELAIEEMTADYTEKLFRSEADFLALMDVRPTLGQKLQNAIKKFIEKLSGRNYAGEDLAKLKEAEEAWTRLLTDRSGKAEAKEKNAGGEKYSIKVLPDGERYVELDVDQKMFDGLSEKEQSQLARKIIKKRFAGKVVGRDNPLFVNARSADEYSYTKRGTSAEAREAKMRASTELNSLFDAGRNFRTEVDGKDGHTHRGIYEWSYFDTYIKMGEQFFDAVINVENNMRGMRFKDITKIKNATNRLTASQNGETPPGRTDSDIFDPKIPQPTSDVKAKFSLKDRSGKAEAKEKNAGGEKYSIKNTRSMSWEQQVRDYFNKSGKLKSSDTFYAGKSNSILAGYGIKEAPLYIPQNVVNKAIRASKGSKSGHALNREDIEKIRNGIDSPAAVVYNPKRNALVYATGLKASRGGYLVLSFDIDNDLYGEKAHRGTSVHARESVEGLFNNLGPEAKVIVFDKEKLNNMLPGIGIQSSKLLAQVEYADNVPQPASDVKAKFSLKDSSGEVYNRTVILSERTIDKYLASYAAKSSPKYAQAYIAYLSPESFISLTASEHNAKKIYAESGELDTKRLGEVSVYQPMFLRIDGTSGEVSGHEGRHRMAALARAGVKRVPVILFDYGNKYGKERKSVFVLKGQDFGSSRSLETAAIDDLIPLSYENREDIIEKFATQPKAEEISGMQTVRYSMRKSTPEEKRAQRKYENISLTQEGTAYTYDFLTSLPDMRVVRFNSRVPFSSKKKIDREVVKERGIKNAELYGGRSSKDTVVVKNRFTGRMIGITRRGIGHSLEGDVRRMLTNACLSQNVGELAENAIPITALNEKNAKASGTYAMISYAIDEKGREVVAVLTINERTDDIENISSIDGLHSLSGRQRKSTGVSNLMEPSVTSPTSASNMVTIAELLDIVKEIYQSILPDDVLSHYGEERNPSGYYYGRVKSFGGARTIDKNTTSGDVPSAVSGGARSTSRSAYDGKIPQQEASVKRKSSIRGQGSEEDIELEIERTQRLAWENDILQEEVRLLKASQAAGYRLSRTDEKDVRKVAARILKEYGSTLSVDDIAGELKEAYDFVGENGSEYVFTESRSRFQAIAEKIIESALEEEGSLYSEYSELRSYLRETALRISEGDAKEIGDYGHFRRRNMGRLRIVKGDTNIDQVWRELSESYPEFFDADTNMSPAEMLSRISEVAEAIYANRGINPFYADGSEAVRDSEIKLSIDLFHEFFDLPHITTLADEQNAKIRELTKEVHKLRQERESTLETIEMISELRKAADKTIDKLIHDKKRVSEKREAAYIRQRIARHAARLSQKLLRPNDKSYVPEGFREAVAAALYSINLSSSFNIDPVSGKRVALDEGVETKRTEAFQRLKTQYAEIAKDYEWFDPDPELMGDGSEDFPGKFEQVIKCGDRRLGALSVEELNTVLDVVLALEKMIYRFGETLSDTKYETTAKWAGSFLNETKTRKTKRAGLAGNLSLGLMNAYSFFDMFGAPGREFYRMLRDAQDLQRRRLDKVAEAIAGVFDKYTEDRIKLIDKLRTDRHEYVTEEGEEIVLTTSMLMDLYNLSGREQALYHLLKDGMVQPEIKKSKAGKKIEEGLKFIHLSSNDIKNLTDNLSGMEKALAGDLKVLENGILADYGNEASLKVFGYRKFTEKNYWTIHTHKAGVKTDIEKQASSQARLIKNMSSAKSVVPHARNAVMLTDVFDDFAQHASDMVGYSCWLAPMEDANRLLNYKFKGTGRNNELSFKQVLSRVAGQGAENYYMNLLANIQNGIMSQTNDDFSRLVSQVVGSAKGAAVGANIRVVVQQPTAILRANAIMDPIDIIRGMVCAATGGRSRDKMLRYAGIARIKQVGGFDQGKLQSVSKEFYGSNAFLDKLNDASGWAAGKADEISWTRIWNAAEWQTRREFPELAPGSKAFYEKAAEIFTEVIDQSQVVDGIIQRAQIMRSGNELTKQATAFMGEPLMSLNMMLRAWEHFRYETDPQKRKEAASKLGRVALALLLTDFVNGLAQSLIDAFRSDEDKEYWERFMTAFSGLNGDEETALDYVKSVYLGSNFVDNASLMGRIPYVKDIRSMLQGYTVDRMDASLISDILQAGKGVVLSDKKSKPYALYKLSSAVSKMFGISITNLNRDVWAIARSIAKSTGNLAAEYEMSKAVWNISSSQNKTRYLDFMYKALEMDEMDVFEKIRKDLMMAGLENVNGDSIEKAMQSRYRKARKESAGYRISDEAAEKINIVQKYSEGASEDTESEKAFSAADLDAAAYERYERERNKAFREAKAALERKAQFKELTSEEKDKVLTDLQNAVKYSALSKASGKALKTKANENNAGIDKLNNDLWIGNAEEVEAAGIEFSDYLLVRNMYNSAHSDKDENGKDIKGQKKGDKVRRYIESYPGLEEGQKAYLWALLGYTSEW